MESESFIEMPDPNDGNYEPTEREIEEYAIWLGADVGTDKDLFWIAREALKAKIPPGWKLYQRKDGSGDPFYFNGTTGESLWDHPLDAHYKQLFAEEKKKKASVPSTSNNRSQNSLGNINLLTQPLQTTTSLHQPLHKGAPSLLPLKQYNQGKQMLSSAPISLISNKNNEKSVSEVETVKEKAQREIEELNTKNDKEIEQIKEKHIIKMNELIAAYKKEEQDQEDITKALSVKRNDIEKTFEEEKRKLELDFNKAKMLNENKIKDAEIEANRKISQIKSQNNEEIEKIKLEHQKKINEIAPKHDKTTSNLSNVANKNSKADDSILKEEIRLLKDEIKTLKEKQKEEVECIKQIHLQELASQKAANLAEIEELKQQYRNYGVYINSTTSSMLKISEISDEPGQMSSKQMRNSSEKITSDMETRMEKLSEQHMKTLKEEEEKLRKEIELLKKEYDDKKKSLRDNGERELAEIKKSNDKAIKAEKAKLEDILRTVRKEAEEKIEKIKEENASEIKRLNKAHMEEIEFIEKGFECKKDSIDSARISNINKGSPTSIEAGRNLISSSSSSDEYYSPKFLSIKTGEDIEELYQKHRNSIEKNRKRYKEKLEKEIENFNLQKELMLAKFDVEKQQIELDHRNEIEQLRQQYINGGNGSLLSTPKSPAWLRFNSFEQFKKSPSEITKLKIGKAVSYSIKYIPNLMIYDTVIFSNQPSIQNIMNMLNIDFTKLHQQRYSDYQQQMNQPTPARTETPYGLNEKLLKQMKSQQIKLEKIQSRFDGNFNNLSGTLKDAIQDVYTLIQGYKNIISEQNKALTQVAMEFHQQTVNLIRKFRETIAEMDNTHRIVKPTYVEILPPSFRSPGSSRRKRIQLETPSTDFEEYYDSGNDAVINFYNWRKSKRSPTKYTYIDS